MALGLAISREVVHSLQEGEEYFRVPNRRETGFSDIFDIYGDEALESSNSRAHHDASTSRTPALTRLDTSSESSQPSTPESLAFSPGQLQEPVIVAAFERRSDGGIRPVAGAEGKRTSVRSSQISGSGANTPRNACSPDSPVSPARKGSRLSISSLGKTFKRLGKSSPSSSSPIIASVRPATPLATPQPAVATSSRGAPAVSAAQEAAHALIAARRAAPSSRQETPVASTVIPSGSSNAAEATLRMIDTRPLAIRTSKGRPKTAPNPETKKLLPPAPSEPATGRRASPVQPVSVPRLQPLAASAFINPWDPSRRPASADAVLPSSQSGADTGSPASAYRSPHSLATSSPMPGAGEISPTTMLPPSTVPFPPLPSLDDTASPLAPPRTSSIPIVRHRGSQHRRISSAGSNIAQVSRWRRESSKVSCVSRSSGGWGGAEIVWAGAGILRTSVDQSLFPSTPSDDDASSYFPELSGKMRRSSSLPTPDVLADHVKHLSGRKLRGDALSVRVIGGVLVQCDTNL